MKRALYSLVVSVHYKLNQIGDFFFLNPVKVQRKLQKHCIFPLSNACKVFQSALAIAVICM